MSSCQKNDYSTLDTTYSKVQTKGFLKTVRHHPKETYGGAFSISAAVRPSFYRGCGCGGGCGGLGCGCRLRYQGVS